MDAHAKRLHAAIVGADAVVASAMQAYLRRCRSGGMPKELSDKIEGAIMDAAELKYFSYALATAANS